MMNKLREKRFLTNTKKKFSKINTTLNDSGISIDCKNLSNSIHCDDENNNVIQENNNLDCFLINNDTSETNYENILEHRHSINLHNSESDCSASAKTHIAFNSQIDINCKVDVGTQITKTFENEERITFLSCNRLIDVCSSYSHAEVQTNIHIPVEKKFSDCCSQTDFNTHADNVSQINKVFYETYTQTIKKKSRNKFSQTDEKVFFQGYINMKGKGQTFKDLCGVSESAFNLLLKVSEQTNTKKKISNENRYSFF